MTAATLVAGLAVLLSACGPVPKAAPSLPLVQVGAVVDVSQETRALMDEHYVGCGALAWVMTGPPTGVKAASVPTFLVAEVSPGKVLVGYFAAEQSKPIQYIDRDGHIRQVKAVLPNGVSLLPDADVTALVWQAA